MFVNHGSAFGGVEKHMLDLITRLEPAKFEPIVLCFGRYAYEDTLAADRGRNVKIISGLNRTRFQDYWRTFRELRPDVIVFESGDVADFPWYAFPAAWFSGAGRVIDYQHDLATRVPRAPVNSARGVVRRLAGWRTRHDLERRLTWRFSDTVVCVSNAIRSSLAREYGRNVGRRSLTIWNGVDVKHFSPPRERPVIQRTRLGIGPGEKVVLSLARLDPTKRINLLIDAVAQLRAEGVRLKCWIVGRGPEEENLRRRVEEKGLTEDVLFLGFVDDIRPYHHEADVFVLCKEGEGFGIALIEAMASGLPCIAPNNGGPAEIISHGMDGWLIDPGSSSALARMLRYVLEHESKRREASARARQKAVESFSIEACTDKIKRLLDAS
ncbi:MAG: glycosyltransferase [Terriglobia bacterium]